MSQPPSQPPPAAEPPEPAGAEPASSEATCEQSAGTPYGACLGGIEAISAAVLAMSKHLEVREVLQRIVSSARTLLGARYAALGVPDDNGGFAQFVVDGISDEQWRAIGPLPRQHGILAAMLHEATAQRLADLRQDPRFGSWPAAHPELSAFLGVPIADGEEILGAIFLANPEAADDADGPARTFTADDERLLRILAAHAAIALTNARLYERSRELTLVGERARIAHELHDAVSQKLFSLRLTAQAAAALIVRDPDRARAELAQVSRLAAEAADELRSVVVELRPAALDEDGLLPTLQSHVEVLDRAHAASVSFRHDRLGALPPAQEEAVLRVAQEALHNALRHSGASGIQVELLAVGTGKGTGRGARLRVRDDGQGFAPDQVRRAGRHLGLVSMRDRASGVGGTLRIDSSPGRGTVVELEVPGG
jgi:signal transduction histidine kinase